MSDDDRIAKGKAALAKGVSSASTIMASEADSVPIATTLAMAVTGAIDLVRMRAIERGLWVTKANLLTIIIKNALDLLRAEDEALSIELIEAFARAARTVNSTDGEAAHLEAMEAIGVVLHQFGEIERKQAAEAQL